MTKEITLTLPDEVYEQVRQAADADQRPMADVLVDSIAQMTPVFYVSPDRPAMLRERAAFLAMHSQLMESYEGQFVAFFQGQVIDHDVDALALVRRINDDRPDDVVLIKQVIEQPDRVLHVRSPRLVRNL